MYINLMSGAKIPDCKPGKTHKWTEVVKPNDNRSGWHEDECDICHVRIGYDTSD